jgi:predicted nucleic acid-binding protein
MARDILVEWTDVARFEATQRFFVKHLDHAWSFTDCLSFVVMKELRLRDSLTSDEHFREAGFIAMLAAAAS